MNPIVADTKGAIEQFNGREGETATLLFGLSVSLTLRGFGFAPRHLRRWAASLEIERKRLISEKFR